MARAIFIYKLGNGGDGQVDMPSSIGESRFPTLNSPCISSIDEV